MNDMSKEKENLKRIADKTDNKQLKEAIKEKLTNKEVKK